jgi:hypothetical protein
MSQHVLYNTYFQVTKSYCHRFTSSCRFRSDLSVKAVRWPNLPTISAVAVTLESDFSWRTFESYPLGRRRTCRLDISVVVFEVVGVDICIVVGTDVCVDVGVVDVCSVAVFLPFVPVGTSRRCFRFLRSLEPFDVSRM